MSQVAVSLASRLGEFVGAGRVLTDPASLAAYEVDGRRPSAALLPGSVAEIAEILRFASAERLAVVPVGGKTHLHIGMPPHRYDLALDVSGMNRVLAYEPHDLTLGVEPGITYAELGRRLLPSAPRLAESSPQPRIRHYATLTARRGISCWGSSSSPVRASFLKAA